MRGAEGGKILTAVRTNFYKERVSCERSASWVHMSCSAGTLRFDFAVCPEDPFSLDWAVRERWLGKTQILLDATYTEVPT